MYTEAHGQNGSAHTPRVPLSADRVAHVTVSLSMRCETPAALRGQSRCSAVFERVWPAPPHSPRTRDGHRTSYISPNAHDADSGCRQRAPPWYHGRTMRPTIMRETVAHDQTPWPMQPTVPEPSSSANSATEPPIMLLLVHQGRLAVC